MKLRREFLFDAAHHLSSYEEGHPNRRMHGHSFRVRVSLSGSPDTVTGQIMDLDQFKAALDSVQSRLDHNLLNDINDLALPTLEHISIWIWNQLSPQLPGLSEIEVFRDSLGQSVSYQGPDHG